MEDSDWAEPLLKDCLFSEVLSEAPELRLPELSVPGFDDFCFPDDDLAGIPTSELFGASVGEEEESKDDVKELPPSVLLSGRGESAQRSYLEQGTAGLPTVKLEDSDCEAVDRNSNCSQPTSHRNVHSMVLSKPGAGTSPYEYGVGGQQSASPSRPRLLIATLPNNVTVIRKRPLERVESSPSPPSSDGSAGEFPGGAFGSFRHRSKMHELALKNNLITEQDPRGNGQVQLSSEERRTLIQEGFNLPTRLPLTKQEEESLKVVRRKIKNKLSAQESRRKRKEYMETLEHRVQNYHSENASLRQRLRQLEQSNRSLSCQLKKLQTLVGGSVPSVSIATQTGVCLTALILLFAVFIPTVPSVFPGHQFSSPAYHPVDASPLPTPSRVLDGDAEHCDLPYSPGFFIDQRASMEQPEEKTEASDLSVRAEQEELFFTYEKDNFLSDLNLTDGPERKMTCDLATCQTKADLPITSDA